MDGRLTVTSLLDMIQSGVPILRYDHRGPAFNVADERIGRSAVDRGDGWAYEFHKQRFGIPDPEPGRRRVGELGEALLAGAQGCLGSGALDGGPGALGDLGEKRRLAFRPISYLQVTD